MAGNLIRSASNNCLQKSRCERCERGKELPLSERTERRLERSDDMGKADLGERQLHTTDNGESRCARVGHVDEVGIVLKVLLPLDDLQAASGPCQDCKLPRNKQQTTGMGIRTLARREDMVPGVCSGAAKAG